MLWRLRERSSKLGTHQSAGLLLPIPQEAKSLGSSSTWGGEICSPRDSLDRQAVQTLGTCGQTLGHMVRFMKSTHWFSEEDLEDMGSILAMGTQCFWRSDSLVCSYLPNFINQEVRESVVKRCLTSPTCLFSPGDAHYNFNWFAQNASGETAV